MGSSISCRGTCAPTPATPSPLLHLSVSAKMLFLISFFLTLLCHVAFCPFLFFFPQCHPCSHHGSAVPCGRWLDPVGSSWNWLEPAVSSWNQLDLVGSGWNHLCLAGAALASSHGAAIATLTHKHNEFENCSLLSFGQCLD